MKRIFIYAVCAFVLVVMIIRPERTMSAASAGLELCIKVIIPSLLPFFILNYILIHSGFITVICAAANGAARRIFNISSNAVGAVALGLTSGYPLGAKSACSLLENKKITAADFERVIAFCNNAGPLFVIGTVGVGMFASKEAGYLLFGVHIISAVTVGALFRFYKRKEKAEAPPREKAERLPYSRILTGAVSEGITSVLNVCGYIIFFNVIAASLNVLYFLNNETLSAVLNGLLEMSGGIKSVSALNIDPVLKLTLASVLLGFGGICIHAQTWGILGGLPKKTYLAGKTAQGIISGVITYIICNYFNFGRTASVFAQTAKPPVKADLFTLVFMFVIIFMILTKSIEKK